MNSSTSINAIASKPSTGANKTRALVAADFGVTVWMRYGNVATALQHADAELVANRCWALRKASIQSPSPVNKFLSTILSTYAKS
jgi:hypothetical protein